MPRFALVDCAPEFEVTEGDLIRKDTGSCYLVDEARRSPRTPSRWNLLVTRLEDRAIAPDARDAIHTIPVGRK